MQIDLNKSSDFTLANVAKLITSGDDTSDTQLRVTTKGIAYLSKTVGAQSINDLAFRLETWSAGSDYVGMAASQDTKWVERVYNALKKNWPNPTTTYIDVF